MNFGLTVEHFIDDAFAYRQSAAFHGVLITHDIKQKFNSHAAPEPTGKRST